MYITFDHAVVVRLSSSTQHNSTDHDKLITDFIRYLRWPEHATKLIKRLRFPHQFASLYIRTCRQHIIMPSYLITGASRGLGYG